MSNKIKLKRSSSPSSVPQLVDLSLGELAVNTFDGKIFFKKDDGSESIGSIVTTNAQITRSIELIGAVTSSLFLINNDSASSDIFLVKVGGNPKIKINQQGTFVINESATLPTPETGAIVVSGSNFFVYL